MQRGKTSVINAVWYMRQRQVQSEVSSIHPAGRGKMGGMQGGSRVDGGWKRGSGGGTRFEESHLGQTEDSGSSECAHGSSKPRLDRRGWLSAILGLYPDLGGISRMVARCASNRAGPELNLTWPQHRPSQSPGPASSTLQPYTETSVLLPSSPHHRITVSSHGQADPALLLLLPASIHCASCLIVCGLYTEPSTASETT